MRGKRLVCKSEAAYLFSVGRVSIRAWELDIFQADKAGVCLRRIYAYCVTACPSVWPRLLLCIIVRAGGEEDINFRSRGMNKGG